MIGIVARPVKITGTAKITKQDGTTYEVPLDEEVKIMYQLPDGSFVEQIPPGYEVKE